MRTLYHLWLSPPCRLVRAQLEAKKLDYELKAEKVWERRPEFLKLNPAGEVPVLVDGKKAPLAGTMSICEYLEEVYPEPPLMSETPEGRAEVRRILEWFHRKFMGEVSDLLISEKVMKRYLKLGVPDTSVIRCGLENLKNHMAYISHLAGKNNYLAGDNMTLADLAAASHISAIDYLGEINWADYPRAREWYAKVKARKCFRPILKDYIAGMPPPPHYTSPDF